MSEIRKKDNESDHDHYMRINKLKIDCQVEIDRPRCINCLNFKASRCTKHETIVPDEYIFAVNDCSDFYNDGIPF